MPDSLEQLQEAEDEALGDLLAWMLPGPDRDRMKEDIRAYRTAIERRVRAEVATGLASLQHDPELDSDQMRYALEAFVIGLEPVGFDAHDELDRSPKPYRPPPPPAGAA